MADETQPKTVYSEDDIARFLQYITDPHERAQKKVFFKSYGELFSAVGARHALVPTDFGQTIDRVVENAAVAAERITG